jgi:hypothetical protein
MSIRRVFGQYRPNGDRSVIEFDDIHAVGVRLPVKNVVEQLNEKMNE